MVTKSRRKPPEEHGQGGRPRHDPADLRSDRLVVRIHPDLMSELIEASREQGISRSLFVERVLLTFLNSRRPDGHPQRLDRIGRYEKPAPADSKGSVDAIANAWTGILQPDVTKRPKGS
jgi:hypothetical protein